MQHQGKEKIKLPGKPTPSMLRKCYVESMEDVGIQAIIDSYGFFYTDENDGVIKINNIMTVTKKYDGIDIDDEKLRNLPKYLQTLYMDKSEDHKFTSPDANRVMNKLYTACVFNKIQVYCHDIQYLTMKVVKTYM